MDVHMQRGNLSLTDEVTVEGECILTIDLIQTSFYKTKEKVTVSVQNPEILATLKEKTYSRYGDVFVEVFAIYLTLCRETIAAKVESIQSVALDTLSKYSNRELSKLLIDRDTFTNVGISLLHFETDLRVLKNRHSELLEYSYERLGPIEMDLTLMLKEYDVYTKLILTGFDLFASAISANLSRVAVLLSIVAVIISLIL